jgi:hypothetical protein
LNVHPFDPGPLVLTDDPDRPTGLHVSQIINRLLQTLDPKRYTDDLPVMKIVAGLALEQQLEKVLALQVPGGFRPGAVKKDGIWCSPDAMAMDPWRVREFKLTWYSAKTKPCPFHEVYWSWRVQMMAYCWVMETQISELWVFFVNGFYPVGAPSPLIYIPDAVPCVIDWSMQELEENWQMILNHAKLWGWL